MLLNNITEQTLDNGLKVIALYKPGASIVAVQLWYKTGSISFIILFFIEAVFCIASPEQNILKLFNGTIILGVSVLGSDK